TRLNFLPTVLGNGQVHLEAEPEVSTLAGGMRSTQRIHTAMELKAGQTVLMGGLGQPVEPAKDGELVVLVTPSVILSGTKQHGQTKGYSRKEASEQLHRLERRLKQLQGEVDDLHRELRSLRGSDPVGVGEK